VRQSSSIGRELLWLALFLAIFIIMTWLVLEFFIGRAHFNDKIAIMLCALFSGLIWIAIRAAVTRRA
jgi:hypothetical protein